MVIWFFVCYHPVTDINGNTKNDVLRFFCKTNTFDCIDRLIKKAVYLFTSLVNVNKY